MTPKQRMTAFRNGQDVDRIPIMPFMGTISSRIAGLNLREMRSGPKTEAESQLAGYRRLGHDCLISDYGLHGIGIAMGSRVNDPEHGVIAIQEYALDDLNKVDQLDQEKVRRRHDSKLARHYAAAEIMLAEAGDECGLNVNLTGPFTAAASIYPTEKLLRALVRDPENVRRLLRFCTDCLKIVCREYLDLGVGFTICDPIASGTMMKKENYQDFVYPYTRELVDDLHGLGASVGYHICGNTAKIVEPMVDTGVDMLSLDNAVDMGMAKEKVGDRICLVGNVDPTGVMMLGDGEAVEEAVKTCFQKTFDSPCGFVLATGCDVPYDAPLENLDYFMAAGRKYGRWPLDQALYA
jgi:uroporphyrinogen decarboxylase